jgi:hypothetical protein
MGKIYSSAANVIAWLGCDQGSSRAVRKLGDLLTGRLSLFGLYCDLMEDIESSPYWKRLWIGQEMMLATELFAMCGPEYFNGIARHLTRGLMRGGIQLRTSRC